MADMTLPTPARGGAIAGLAISYRSQVLAMIAGFMVLRLIADAFIGLGTDESYSVGASGQLSLSYFDHPPLHYWIVHLVQSWLGRGRADRLPFIALFAGTSWLMFVLTRRLFDARAGVWAVAALNLAGFFSVAAGGWVLPDGPLIFALTGAATALARGWFPLEGEPARPWRSWLLAGIWIGLAALSKYQASLFCAGVGLFVLTVAERRGELARPALYLAALITLAMLSPVLIWNAQHHWASFVFQGGRETPNHVHPFGAFGALAGQAAILLPWVFVPVVIAAFAAAKAGPADQRRWFCLMLGAPAIALFTLLPMFGPKALPHWSMPGWIFLFPLTGAYLSGAAATRAWPRTWAAVSAGVLVLAGGLLVYEDATGWLGQAFPKAFKRGDPTAESIEWTALRPALAKRGLLGPKGPLIVALKWTEAGKVDQALGADAQVTAFSPDPRQFAFRGDRAQWLGHDAVILGRAETVKARMAGLRPYFRTLSVAPPIYVGRQGRPEIEVAVVLAQDLLKPYPLPGQGEKRGG